MMSDEIVAPVVDEQLDVTEGFHNCMLLFMHNKQLMSEQIQCILKLVSEVCEFLTNKNKLDLIVLLQFNSKEDYEKSKERYYVFLKKQSQIHMCRFCIHYAVTLNLDIDHQPHKLLSPHVTKDFNESFQFAQLRLSSMKSTSNVQNSTIYAFIKHLVNPNFKVGDLIKPNLPCYTMELMQLICWHSNYRNYQLVCIGELTPFLFYPKDTTEQKQIETNLEKLICCDINSMMHYNKSTQYYKQCISLLFYMYQSVFISTQEKRNEMKIKSIQPLKLFSYVEDLTEWELLHLFSNEKQLAHAKTFGDVNHIKTDGTLSDMPEEFICSVMEKMCSNVINRVDKYPYVLHSYHFGHMSFIRLLGRMATFITDPSETMRFLEEILIKRVTFHNVILLDIFLEELKYADNNKIVGADMFYPGMLVKLIDIEKTPNSVLGHLSHVANKACQIFEEKKEKFSIPVSFAELSDEEIKEKQLECPVCLESKLLMRITNCSHHLCFRCYALMCSKTENSNECPLCRQVMVIKNLSLESPT